MASKHHAESIGNNESVQLKVHPHGSYCLPISHRRFQPRQRALRTNNSSLPPPHETHHRHTARAALHDAQHHECNPGSNSRLSIHCCRWRNMKVRLTKVGNMARQALGSTREPSHEICWLTSFRLRAKNAKAHKMNQWECIRNPAEKVLWIPNPLHHQQNVSNIL